MKQNVLFLLMSILMLSIEARPKSGDLDPTFGTNGSVSINSIDSIEYIKSGTAVQPDGKILAASNRFTGSSVVLVVVRLNSDGTTDTAFGSNGVFQTSFGGIVSAGICLALQSDGKIVVGGVSGTDFGDGNFALTRINPNGTLDTTFGVNGKVITSFAPGFSEIVQDLVIQPDGKIIAVGTSQSDALEQSLFAAARYNSDGQLDSSFDGDGKLTAAASDRPENFGYAADIDRQGRILIGGGVEESVVAESELAIIRLNPNGTLDTTFGGDGKVQISIVGQSEYIHKLKVQDDQKIIAVGYSNVDKVGNGDDDFAVVRLNTDGSLDETFSGDGKMTFSFDEQNDFEQPWGVEIRQSGKIVVGGVSGRVDPNNRVPILSANFAVAQLNPDGTFDAGFGSGGKIITNFSSPINLGFDLAIQSDGKIVQVGYTGDTDFETLNSKITLVRYLPDGTPVRNPNPIFDFDGDSKTDISIFRPSNGEWWYRKSSDGGNFAAQFGSSTDKIVPADYTGDGKTDLAFFRPTTGQWFILRSEDASYYGFSFGSDSDIPMPADYDGDGKADAAVWRPSTGTWFILKSAGGLLVLNFGLTGDKPVASDYDGDGKADLAIYRPNDGTWWIRRSRDENVLAVKFGEISDTPVPGDYTGDGKTDIAFWRESTGTWTILRSENNSFYAFPFGASGDIPVLGDYDGDGKFDAAVFRPIVSNWYVMKSSSGISIQHFGTAGDLPIPNVFTR